MKNKKNPLILIGGLLVFSGFALKASGADGFTIGLHNTQDVDSFGGVLGLPWFPLTLPDKASWDNVTMFNDLLPDLLPDYKELKSNSELDRRVMGILIQSIDQDEKGKFWAALGKKISPEYSKLPSAERDQIESEFRMALQEGLENAQGPVVMELKEIKARLGVAYSNHQITSEGLRNAYDYLSKFAFYGQAVRDQLHQVEQLQDLAWRHEKSSNQEQAQLAGKKALKLAHEFARSMSGAQLNPVAGIIVTPN